ncbi:MAG: four-carbon acid sugar kinase family protein [Dehalococcoidia bacterium]
MPVDIVVADDLTGAADTLAQFLPCAARTLVFPSLHRFEAAVKRDDLPDASLAIGVSTESRHLSPRAAAARVHRAHAAALRLSPRLLFQKVDSAMRGNPGAEVAAYRQATGVARVLLCPAFLPSGRTVLGGVLYVHGEQLAESAIGRDLRSPAADSSVLEILRLETDTRVSGIAAAPHGDLRGLADAFRRSPPGIVVADAESTANLESLARLILADGLARAVSGSAGLAGAIAQVLRAAPRDASRIIGRTGLVLAILGSPHTVARRQAEVAAAHYNVPILRLDPADRPAHLTRAAAVVLRERGLALIAGPAMTSDAANAPRQIALALAATAWSLARGLPITGLFASGGDVAAAVCAALQVDRLELIDQIFPGAPVSCISGGIADGVTLATKRGGTHGDENGLTSILERLGAFDVRLKVTDERPQANLSHQQRRSGGRRA